VARVRGLLSWRRHACDVHHWHLTGRGWTCCNGGHHVSAEQVRPADSAVTACRDDDGLTGWLGGLSPVYPQPAGARVGRQLRRIRSRPARV
jgi:hypothetical protein